MTKEKIRGNAGFILGGKKVNIEKFKTRYLTFSGLVILAGILVAVLPSLHAGMFIIDQYMLQLSFAIIFLGPVILLLVMYTQATKSECRAPTIVPS